MSDEGIEQFILRWQNSEAAERANFQLFASELCALLDVGIPDPSGTPGLNSYIFEHTVKFKK